MSLAQLTEMKNEYMSRIQKDGKALLKGEFESFFKKNPTVTALSWTQYTPYFNDGDACTFGLGELNGTEAEFTKEDANNFSSYEMDEPISAWSFKYDAEKSGEPLDQVEYKRLQALDEEINALAKTLNTHEDLLETVFGDHVCVVALPGGEFVVNEYSHD